MLQDDEESLLRPRLLAHLARIIDPARLSTDPAERARLGSDALGPSRGLLDVDPGAHLPDIVARPESIDEIVALVQFASERTLPIVPVGGGSGLMGGARAIRGGILLDLTGMRQVLAISPENRSVTTQAGATIASVDAALALHGRLLGHDPWTVKVATVGGAISTNGLGYRGARVGPMRDQVLGLTAVLPDGRILRTPAVPTHSTGPDLTRLFVGAEGTLGVIVEATLRTYPRPRSTALFAYDFPSFESGFQALLQIAEADLRPSLLDFGEEPPEAASRLYLGFEGHPASVQEATDLARSFCTRALAVPDEEAVEFWQQRHRYGDSYAEARRTGRVWSRHGLVDYVHAAIPADRVLEYRQRCWRRFRSGPITLGEIGVWTAPDLVSLVLHSRQRADATARRALAAGVDWAIAEAQALGGSMEYCHGVGIRLAHVMAAELGPGLDVLRAIKHALDPKGILNPGKLGL